MLEARLKLKSFNFAISKTHALNHYSGISQAIFWEMLLGICFYLFFFKDNWWFCNQIMENKIRVTEGCIPHITYYGTLSRSFNFTVLWIPQSRYIYIFCSCFPSLWIVQIVSSPSVLGNKLWETLICSYPALSLR